MGKALDQKLLNDWKEFIVSELKHNKIYSNMNPFYFNDFLSEFRKPILEEVRYSLQLPNSEPDIDWRRMYNNRELDLVYNDLKPIIYLDFYLENAVIILEEVNKELGRQPYDSTSLDKKFFILGLQDLIGRADPGFLDNLKYYLSTNGYLLKELKKYLGISDEDDTFDAELSILLKSGYQRLFEMVSSDAQEMQGQIDYIFNQFLDGNGYFFKDLFAVGKEWLYLYVKLSFDPPTASTLTYLKERLNELEWYIVNYNLGDWIYGEQKHAGSETSWN